MKLKSQIQIISAVLLLGLSQTAFGQATYVTPLNTALATSGLSCSACHVNGVTTIAAASRATGWKSITTSTDTDGDGVTDGLEVRMGTDFFDAASKPAGAGANGVWVDPATTVTTAAATDLATETGNATLTGTIVDSKSITPTLTTAGSVTLAFQDFAVTGAKVYEVVGATSTEITTVTENTTGSITFTTTSAQPKLLVVGTTSTSGSTVQAEAKIYGCVSAPFSWPLALVFASLFVGLGIRKQA